MNRVPDDGFITLLQREAAAAARRRALRRRAGGAGLGLALVLAAVWVAPARLTPTVPSAPSAVVDRRADLAAYAITDDELREAFEETGLAYYIMWEQGTPVLVSPEETAAGRGPA